MSERQESSFDHQRPSPKNRWWSELAAVIKTVGNLLADWWNRDRIRVSPTVGRLLSLQHGDRILLGGRLFHVQQVCAKSEAWFVSYTLVSETESALLKVKRDQNGLATEGWLESQGNREIVFDDDVAVLSAVQT